jgi:phosphatidylglycerol:prolipoprotein diacylglycerol transferase
LTFHFAKKAGFDDKTISNCLMIAIVSSLLGARILFFISNPSLFAIDKFFAFQDGGLVAYGGYLGGIIGSFVYLVLRKKSFWNFADQAAPSLALGLGLTRIGCFLYGCDYGAPTDFFLGIRFPKWHYEGLDKWIHSGSPAWEHHMEKCYECIQNVGIHAGAALEDGIRFCHDQLGLTDSMIRECQQGGELTQSFPVHPTQLYESTFGIILFVALLFVKRFRKFDGQLFLIFILAYSVFRFLIEFIRDDLQRGSMAGLSTSQIIAVFLVIFSVILWFNLLKRKVNVESLDIKK